MTEKANERTTRGEEGGMNFKVRPARAEGVFRKKGAPSLELGVK